MILKTTHKNWLLATGISGFLFSLLLFFILKLESDVSISRDVIKLPLYIFLFFGVFIAPIIEEITFRGVLTKKRVLIYLSIIISIIYLILSFKNNFLCLIPYSISVYYVYIKQYRHNILILSLALFFALVHYDYQDLTSIRTFYLPLAQFSTALVLSWVVINYNIIKSILAHACFNLFVISLLLISIQFPDESTSFHKNNNIRIEYNKTPYFSKQRKSEIKYLDSALVINSFQPKKIHEIFTKKYKREYNSDQFQQVEPYMKYDITIYHNSQVNQKQIDSVLIQFLEKKLLTEIISSSD